MNPLLIANADAYSRVALLNIRREFPHGLAVVLDGPLEQARPRELHPVFYGSFDWHSCVEMFWLLARLLRVAPDEAPRQEIHAVFDEHLTPENVAVEVEFLRRQPGFERPYGWGWALALAAELGEPWRTGFRPLADQIAAGFVEWLPKLTYPVRHGVHANTAFALSRSLPYSPELREAIRDATLRWFATDEDYPGGWEPSGADFLSGALCEAELMACLLDPDEFSSWFGRFLPRIAEHEPAALFTPAVVSDVSDGQIAHLHGLNMSRAWAWRRLAATLPPEDPRVAAMTEAAQAHADAALPHVTGSDYTVEHWLAAYAVLYLGA